VSALLGLAVLVALAVAIHDGRVRRRTRYLPSVRTEVEITVRRVE